MHQKRFKNVFKPKSVVWCQKCEEILKNCFNCTFFQFEEFFWQKKNPNYNFDNIQTFSWKEIRNPGTQYFLSNYKYPVNPEHFLCYKISEKIAEVWIQIQISKLFNFSKIRYFLRKKLELTLLQMSS